jgi:hypothetical protein
VPGLLRLAETAVVLVVAACCLPDSAVWAFAWLFVVAYHHYDTLYRALGGSWPPQWLVRAGLGVEGRTLVVIAAAVASGAVLEGLLAVGSVVLFVLFVLVASAQWMRALRARGGNA